MINIEIYVKKNCPFCKRAIEFLSNNGLSFRKILVDDDKIYNKMVSRCGRKTVPQIFFGDKHLGGWDDLNQLNIEGKFENYFK